MGLRWMEPILKWDVFPQKSVGPPCAWNRNPWKSQTMSIWFGHVSHVFFWKKIDKIQPLLSAGFVGIPKPWLKNATLHSRKEEPPKQKPNPYHTTWCGFRIWNLPDIRANTSELEHMDRGITKLHKKNNKKIVIYTLTIPNPSCKNTKTSIAQFLVIQSDLFGMVKMWPFKGWKVTSN